MDYSYAFSLSSPASQCTGFLSIRTNVHHNLLNGPTLRLFLCPFFLICSLRWGASLTSIKTSEILKEHRMDIPEMRRFQLLSEATGDSLETISSMNVEERENLFTGRFRKLKQSKKLNIRSFSYNCTVHCLIEVCLKCRHEARFMSSCSLVCKINFPAVSKPVVQCI